MSVHVNIVHLELLDSEGVVQSKVQQVLFERAGNCHFAVSELAMSQCQKPATQETQPTTSPFATNPGLALGTGTITFLLIRSLQFTIIHLNLLQAIAWLLFSEYGGL